MNEKQTDEYILDKKHCGKLTCEDCYYGMDKKEFEVLCRIKRKFCTAVKCHDCKYAIQEEEGYCKYIYEYIHNKYKIKKLKEILK